jgi:hypothetical protein
MSTTSQISAINSSPPTPARVATSPVRTTLADVANVLIPFALLLSAALLKPEMDPDLTHSRVIYTIWVSIVFMIPALFLYFVPGRADRVDSYERLFWTAALLAYLVHFYYTVGVIFHGHLSEVYAAQGPLIATSNLLDTVWWVLDVVLAWFALSGARWLRAVRTGAHLYIPATFFVSAVVIKHGLVRALGLLMTVSLLGGLALRLWRRSHAAAVTP